MSNPPLVSVITVTYNSSNYIKDAIDSILASSYANFELIIGDDASSDNTWSIIQEYNDDRILAYRNSQNLREYPNRNKAISLAKGKYLIFIDGDDMIYPHGLEFMVKMLHAFPDCGMALMRWFQNDLFFPIVITPQQFYIGEYFGHGFLGTGFSNVLFRTNILKEQGGLSNSYRSGDNFIRYAIAARYNSLVINDGLTWWRETPGQASGAFSSSLQGTIESFKLKFEFLQNSNCPMSANDLQLAKDNLHLLLSKIIVRLILKGRIKSALLIQQNFGIPFKDFLRITDSPCDKNPFEGFSTIRPYSLPLVQNPYSKKNSRE
jgi:glycosyltransferase involved in cell wall biosynthesis